MYGLKSVRKEAVKPQTIKLKIRVIVFLVLLVFSMFKEVKQPQNTGNVN